jgi:glycosyltransferase involved in cell wall biosynthesis
MIKVLMLAAFAMEKHDAELIHFSSISNGLKRLGYDVTIYHLSEMHESAIKDLLHNDIEFHETFIKAKTNNEMFIKGILAYPLFLISIVRNKPDVIYARLGIVTGIYIILTKLLFRNRIKTITEQNGWIGPEAKDSGKPKLLYKIGELIQKWASKSSDSIRAVSEGIREYLISMNICRGIITVIGNGTSINHFKPVANSNCFDFGFIGNIARWQGVEWLIKSFALALKEKPGLSLVIGGSGPHKADCVKLAHDYGIVRNVIFAEQIPYSEANNFINNIHICMAPFLPRGSSNDNKALSPLKIRDYAACGKPIISSKIPGLEEIEKEGFGILVEPGNIDELKNAMIYLLDNPDQIAEMGRKARFYAEKNYSWDIIVKCISEEIIQPLIKYS